MNEAIELDLELPSDPTDGDNITDWCLEQFHGRYGTHITKDDIYEYLYGVMHAPDWRERYKHDLQRNLPKVPLAPDFEAFRTAGRALMDLYINYETVDEYPLVCLVDNEPDEGEADHDAYRIEEGISNANPRQEDALGQEGQGNRPVRLRNQPSLQAHRHSRRSPPIRRVGPQPAQLGH